MSDYPTMSQCLSKDDLIKSHREVIDQLRAELKSNSEEIHAIYDSIEMLEETTEQYRAELEELKAARAGVEDGQVTIDIRRSRVDGTPEPKITKFTDLGDGTHTLYTAPPVVVPDGWQLVPTELTEDQLNAASMPLNGSIAGYEMWRACAVYAAMLKAAPQPTKTN